MLSVILSLGDVLYQLTIDTFNLTKVESGLELNPFFSGWFVRIWISGRLNWAVHLDNPIGKVILV